MKNLDMENVKNIIKDRIARNTELLEMEKRAGNWDGQIRNLSRIMEDRVLYYKLIGKEIDKKDLTNV